MTSEQMALATMFYFEQVFVFCMLINKNLLEWFLIIICKEYTLLISANVLSRNHPTLCFCLIREGRQMPSTEQLRYRTDKINHWRCSIKKAVLENFAIFTRKHPCWSLFFNFIKKRTQHSCFAVANGCF